MLCWVLYLMQQFSQSSVIYDNINFVVVVFCLKIILSKGVGYAIICAAVIGT